MRHMRMLEMNPSLDYEDIKAPNSPFRGDVSKQRRNCLVSLPELVYGSKEFNSRRVRLHMTK